MYDVHYTGEEETFDDKIRSILAQLEFSHEVKVWDSKGVPFCSHLYVPEIHPETQSIFHEREDEGHVFKVRLLLGNQLCVQS